MNDRKLEAFGRLLNIMDELRVKCPWDREQTFESLRNSTIEETYELVDALMDHDLENIKKELGDLLLHVVFYARIGSEEGAFDIADVADGVSDKLVFRHPHVFGNVEAETPEEVKQNWEDIKLKEKEQAREKKRVLSGVPRSLTSLVKAYRIGQKAASAGFDWEQKEDVWAKVREEIGELQAEMDAFTGAWPDGKVARTESSASDDPKESGHEPGMKNGATTDSMQQRMEEEFGDLLFSLVNMARLYGINPDAALEKCNRKFISRFTYVEDRVEAAGKTLRETPLHELEKLWCEAKSVRRS